MSTLRWLLKPASANSESGTQVVPLSDLKTTSRACSPLGFRVVGPSSGGVCGAEHWGSACRSARGRRRFCTFASCLEWLKNKNSVKWELRMRWEEDYVFLKNVFFLYWFETERKEEGERYGNIDERTSLGRLLRAPSGGRAYSPDRGRPGWHSTTEPHWPGLMYF